MPPRLIKALVFIGVWLEESAFRLSKGSAFVGGAVAVIGIPVMNCWPPRKDKKVRCERLEVEGGRTEWICHAHS